MDKSALKQILFNLLNNALKHGAGDIYLRVRAHGTSLSLVIGNRSEQEKPKGSNGLGIGLRLVRALASQSKGTRVSFRNGGYFWARLRLTAPAQACHYNRTAILQ